MNGCICGEIKNYTKFKRPYYNVNATGKVVKAKDNNILFGMCDSCGIVRQVSYPSFTKDRYEEFYRTQYPPTKSSYKIKDYEHDRKLALKRCNQYGIRIIGDIGDKILDVGCGSGAFVDECRSRNKEAYGCEISEYHYAKEDKYIYKKSLEDCLFPTDYFDKVTCHDVLEHFMNPVKLLKDMFRILKQKGTCIIDFPDYFIDEGKHHWKAEHIWYFTIKQLEKIAVSIGFKIKEIKKPIKSKVVFYLIKPKQNRVKILVPPGMGDSYWSITKMEAFLKREGLGIPDVLVASPRDKIHNGHMRSFPFIELYPFLNSTYKVMDAHANQPEKRKIWVEAYTKRAETIFKDVLDCDYFLSYNGHLRFGEQMENIDSDLETNWFSPMFESLEQIQYKNECIRLYGKYIVFYFVFQGTYAHWTKQFSLQQVVRSIKRISKETGCVPILTGASWDKVHDVLSEVVKDVPECIDLRGETTVAQLFGLIKGSEIVVGYPSGLTIMSAAMKQKTLTIWNDYYNRDFAWYSCPPSVRNKTYFIEFTNDLQPKYLSNRVKTILEIK